MNKKLTHTFVHFVISSQSRFYTLTPFSVFYVDIHSSSLRLFKIDVVVSSTSNPSTIFYFSFVLAITLALRYICFKYLDCVFLYISHLSGQLFFRPVT